MNSVLGDFQFSGSAQSFAARATIDEGAIHIVDVDDESVVKNASLEDATQGMTIPGLAVHLTFSDGAFFTPRDADFRWPKPRTSSALAARLETNRLAIFISLIALVLVTWLMITKVIPGGAAITAKLLPMPVKTQMGQQTKVFLEKTLLQPSKLSIEQREEIERTWQRVKQEIAGTDYNYELNLYDSPAMGANAFALPNGAVIVTDELARRLVDKPDALIAVLLHEIGHIENQHGIQLVAQSLGVTFVFASLFGDLEGAAELFLGAGSSLLQNAFSRDMEREADNFALVSLAQLGIPSTAFADAIKAISEGAGQEHSNDNFLDKYLSSHPQTQERIQNAEDKAPSP